MQQITLKNPITAGGEDLKEVQVRSPGAGELRGLSLAALAELEVDTVLELLPRVTIPAITEEEGETLSLVDLLKIGGAMINPDGEKAGNGGSTPKP